MFCTKVREVVDTSYNCVTWLLCSIFYLIADSEAVTTIPLFPLVKSEQLVLVMALIVFKKVEKKNSANTRCHCKKIFCNLYSLKM